MFGCDEVCTNLINIMAVDGYKYWQHRSVRTDVKVTGDIKRVVTVYTDSEPLFVGSVMSMCLVYKCYCACYCCVCCKPQEKSPIKT